MNYMCKKSCVTTLCVTKSVCVCDKLVSDIVAGDKVACVTKVRVCVWVCV